MEIKLFAFPFLRIRITFTFKAFFLSNSMQDLSAVGKIHQAEFVPLTRENLFGS